MSAPSILIVEDDERLARLIPKFLGKEGIATQICPTGAEAIELVTENPQKMLLLDHQLRDLKGNEVIQTLVDRGIAPSFIMMTGQGDEQLAVECMKLGAIDYLIKDTHFLDLVVPAVKRAFGILDTRQRLREAEESLSTQLREKELLLREIHHRVKNNLAIINSLISLQADSVTDPEQALKAFDKTRDRIYAMSIVHQQLYESQDYGSVSFQDYLRDLVAYLSEHYTSVAGSIHIVFHSEGVFIDVDDAIPLGLMLNELISNSLLYAFPTGAPGTISIGLWEEGDFYHLTVKDDGIGLPEGCTDQGTLGLTLVFSLVEQIAGTSTIENADGACFSLQWPRRK